MSHTLHMHKAEEQPAYRYRDTITVKGKAKTIWVDCSLFKYVQCFDCGKTHRAYNMIVQVYYDAVYPFCRQGFGCRK